MEATTLSIFIKSSNDTNYANLKQHACTLVVPSDFLEIYNPQAFNIKCINNDDHELESQLNIALKQIESLWESIKDKNITNSSSFEEYQLQQSSLQDISDNDKTLQDTLRKITKNFRMLFLKNNTQTMDLIKETVITIVKFILNHDIQLELYEKTNDQQIRSNEWITLKILTPSDAVKYVFANHACSILNNIALYTIYQKESIEISMNNIKSMILFICNLSKKNLNEIVNKSQNSLSLCKNIIDMYNKMIKEILKQIDIINIINIFKFLVKSNIESQEFKISQENQQFLSKHETIQEKQLWIAYANCKKEINKRLDALFIEIDRCNDPYIMFHVIFNLICCVAYIARNIGMRLVVFEKDLSMMTNMVYGFNMVNTQNISYIKHANSDVFYIIYKSIPFEFTRKIIEYACKKIDKTIFSVVVPGELDDAQNKCIKVTVNGLTKSYYPLVSHNNKEQKLQHKQIIQQKKEFEIKFEIKDLFASYSFKKANSLLHILEKNITNNIPHNHDGYLSQDLYNIFDINKLSAIFVEKLKCSKNHKCVLFYKFKISIYTLTRYFSDNDVTQIESTDQIKHIVSQLLNTICLATSQECRDISSIAMIIIFFSIHQTKIRYNICDGINDVIKITLSKSAANIHISQMDNFKYLLLFIKNLILYTFENNDDIQLEYETRNKNITITNIDSSFLFVVLQRLLYGKKVDGFKGDKIDELEGKKINKLEKIEGKQYTKLDFICDIKNLIKYYSKIPQQSKIESVILDGLKIAFEYSISHPFQDNTDDIKKINNDITSTVVSYSDIAKIMHSITMLMLDAFEKNLNWTTDNIISDTTSSIWEMYCGSMRAYAPNSQNKHQSDLQIKNKDNKNCIIF